MSGTLINDYSNVDSNILAVQSTLDKTFFAKNDSISLTNYNNNTVPAIAAGSVVENNGALYQFASEEAISTTDPVTSSTVANGTVYICLIPGTGTITAAFTATAPTWSDSKQGWYLTGSYANYRVIAGVEEHNSTGTVIWNGKFDIENKPYTLIKKFYLKTLIQCTGTVASTTSTSYQTFQLTKNIDSLNEVNTSTDIISVNVKGWYRVTVKTDISYNVLGTTRAFYKTGLYFGSGPFSSLDASFSKLEYHEADSIGFSGIVKLYPQDARYGTGSNEKYYRFLVKGQSTVDYSCTGMITIEKMNY